MKTKILLPLLLFFSFLNLGFYSVNDQYLLDVGHTYIGFDVERFLVGEVTGRFNEFAGDISLQNENIESLQANIKIKTNSLDTNNEIRDGHLKGKMWLDTASYPEINFVSTAVTKNQENQYVMEGYLTIRGITKRIQFPITVSGPFKDPTKKIAIGIKADLVIDRFDFGIMFNKKMDNGSFFIGNEVKIKIRTLAYKK